MHQAYERQLAESISKEIRYVIGVDEAGRGPLAGPVATAATCFSLGAGPLDSHATQFLNDSKVMSLANREETIRRLLRDEAPRFLQYCLAEEHTDPFLFDCIPPQPPTSTSAAQFLGAALWFMPAAEIDKRNILEASLDGMCICAASLMRHLNEQLSNTGPATMSGGEENDECQRRDCGWALLTPHNTMVLVDGPHLPFGLLSEEQRKKKMETAMKALVRKMKAQERNQKKTAPPASTPRTTAKRKRGSNASTDKHKTTTTTAVASASLTSEGFTLDSSSAVLPQYDRGNVDDLRGVAGRPVVHGDALCPSIAAASVVAKVARDHFLVHVMEPQFPQYGFSAHKGYPTAAHLEKLKEHGVCSFHRRSFGPVRASLGVPSEE